MQHQNAGKYGSQHQCACILLVYYMRLVYIARCLGKIPILTNIFQGGWNHQPDCQFGKSYWVTSQTARFLDYRSRCNSEKFMRSNMYGIVCFHAISKKKTEENFHSNAIFSFSIRISWDFSVTPITYMMKYLEIHGEIPPCHEVNEVPTLMDWAFAADKVRRWVICFLFF